MRIDPIITDCLFKSNFRSVIFRKDNFNNFRISFFLPLRNPSTKKEPTFICKGINSYNSKKGLMINCAKVT